YKVLKTCSAGRKNFFDTLRGRRFKTAGPCGNQFLQRLMETTLAGMEIGAVRNTITRLAE
ncbi:hypothetical protein, partial [Dysosmobacter sp.]|uniref:hypothetical protein n=1 Tax=Dysosmobacter sp. TaxID=2591382 RepID=UPI00307E3CBB